MSLRLTVADRPGGSHTESWLVKVDEATTVSEIGEALSVPVEIVAPGADPVAPFAKSMLRSGVVVPSRSSTVHPAGTTRLDFVAGPFAGESVAVVPGEQLLIGRGPSATIRVADPHLAEEHAHITVTGGASVEGAPLPLAARIELVDPTGNLLVNGEQVSSSAEVVPADLVQLGSSVLRVGSAPASDADITVDELGARAFNRPSRIRPSQTPPSVTLPGDEPEEADASPLPWLSAIVPVVLGVTLAIVFQRPVMLLMAAASPIMVVGSFIANKKIAKRKGERTQVEWIAEIESARERIAATVRQQRLTSWYHHLDPVYIRDVVTRPLSRLWERRRSESDALKVRVGVADVRLDVRFEGGPQKERREDRHVGVSPSPVAVDLADGPVGVAGPADVAEGVVRSMITALTALRSPRDLQIAVLCDREQEHAWSWVQWLPHAQPGVGPVALIGNTDLTRRERVREMGALLDVRMRIGRDRRIETESHVVLIVDGARRYRMLPGMVALLEHGAAYGIHVIAIDSDRSRLPEEATTVVVADPGDPLLGRVESGDAYHSPVLLDQVTVNYAEELARALSSIEHVRGVGDDATVPTSVRYTELLGVDLNDPQPIIDQWRVAPRQSFVVIGAGSEGECAVDIATDGPHALVAGTTGSGKSEFLQALVISLALANRPDALNFVLIDYKGGSAFADCARLPHTVGMVTNLDARETERALASLDAELKRRERVLRDEIGAKDVDAAWDKDADAAAKLGLARLMIIVDEFAELKTELPDFINGLVRIARVGRSLGVNLVLATQRPSGVITPEMQSNINLRIALRVTDRADSTDVIGTPDAALISAATPGRGYMRAGLDAAPVVFQTARVAGLRIGHQRTTRVLPPAAKFDWQTVGLPPRFPAVEKAVHRPDQDDTDLRGLVQLATKAAAELGVERSPSPWLLPLPELLPLDRFDEDSAPEGAVVLGLVDVPSRQTQRPLLWHVHNDSHLLFFGGSRSGRTTAVRTLLAQAVQRFTPADLHVYAVDYGTGALLPFVGAPHTGAVITPQDSGRLPRLLARMSEELSRRQSVIAAAGVGSIGEQRAQADARDALSYALFVIDGWERLSASLSADDMVTVRDHVLRLLREGPSSGLRVIITADRSVPSDKVASFIDTRYALPMRDVNDYRGAGIMIREVPSSIPPGRVMFGSSGTEAQLAVLSTDVTGEGQTAAVRAIVEYVSAHYAQFPQLAELPQAFRVDPLPQRIGLSETAKLPLLEGATAEFPVMAVGGDRLSRITVAWPDVGGFVVTGDRRSGKTHALAVIAHQLAWHGTRIVVAVARDGSVLSDVARSHGMPVLTPQSAEADVVAALAAGEQPLTIVVDDSEGIRDSTLDRALASARGHARFVVGVGSESAGSAITVALTEAKKGRAGLLLSPTSTIIGTQVFGVQLARTHIGRGAPGSGMFFSDGTYVPVQVPDLTA